MSSIVTPVRLGLVKIIPEFWDEGLAVGMGIIVTDVIGNFMKSTVGRIIPTKWVDPATEGIIGVLVIALGEMFAPDAYRIYTRLAGVAALGLAIADSIGILLGLGSSVIRGIKPSPISAAISGDTPVSFG